MGRMGEQEKNKIKKLLKLSKKPKKGDKEFTVSVSKKGK